MQMGAGPCAPAPTNTHTQHLHPTHSLPGSHVWGISDPQGTLKVRWQKVLGAVVRLQADVPDPNCPRAAARTEGHQDCKVLTLQIHI